MAGKLAGETGPGATCSTWVMAEAGAAVVTDATAVPATASQGNFHEEAHPCCGQSPA